MTPQGPGETDWLLLSKGRSGGEKVESVATQSHLVSLSHATATGRGPLLVFVFFVFPFPMSFSSAEQRAKGQATQLSSQTALPFSFCLGVNSKSAASV